jgi:CDP-diacylglycerol--serine O-phosphatidyltransferase
MLKFQVNNFKYLLPSFFTLAALMAAFFAILQSAVGMFSVAAYAIIVAMIFDSLDGRTARLTNACTAFGASFDSITDMLAYGVAPAIMMYCWGIYRLGRLGLLISFIFCACAGLRLARFNVMNGVIDKRFFQGLSSTMAGGFMVTYVLACVQNGFYSTWTLYFGAMIMILSAFLMVSNFKFYSFKKNYGLSLAVTLGLLLLLIGLAFKYKGIVVFVVLGLYIILNLLLQPWYRLMANNNS